MQFELLLPPSSRKSRVKNGSNAAIVTPARTRDTSGEGRDIPIRIIALIRIIAAIARQSLMKKKKPRWVFSFSLADGALAILLQLIIFIGGN
jgi:hypothetical protein